MKTRKDSESATEYRLDLRGSNGRVDVAKIMVRDPGGEFVRFDGQFTEEHVQQLQLFAKAASEFAKAAAPPFNEKETLLRINALPRRRHPGRNGPTKPATPGVLAEGSPAPKHRRARVRRR
jgi:hypothetical protein